MNNAGVGLRDNRTDTRRKRGFRQNENEIQKILIRFYGGYKIYYGCHSSDYLSSRNGTKKEGENPCLS